MILTIFNFFSLLGGLAFFLYGMQLLSSSLEQRAGNKLQPILQSLTNSRLKCIMVGAAVTGIIQSSSATTVMLVGFVNSGIMKLQQAISVIFGANIGTTITSWILSLSGLESSNFWVSLLRPSSFAPIMAFIGIVIFFTSKRKRDIASILIGFSILMYGMELMSGSVRGLAEVPAFINMLTVFSNPLLGVLVGTVITGIIQSSTASIGMLQALANTGVITYSAAIPIIMGQNIGTCVTAIISSVGANKNAKRVALAHLYFNMIGTLLFLIIYYVAKNFISLQFMNSPIGALGIAAFHSIFNVTSTIVMFPFIGTLEKLAMKSFRGGDKDDETETMIDDRLLGTPSFAIEQCKKVACDMAMLSKDSLMKSLDLMRAYSEKESEIVFEIEEKVDMYEDKIGSYLVKVSEQQLSEKESQDTSKLLNCIGDLERISDHAKNIVECAQEKSDKGIQFSAEAQKEIAVMMDAVAEIVDMSINSFVRDDVSLATNVEPLEQVIDTIKVSIKNNHIQRLKKGSCTIELGFLLSEILTNLERVADHCSNVAINVIEVEKYGEFNSHQYIQKLKGGYFGETFSEKYNEYLAKYDLK